MHILFRPIRPDEIPAASLLVDAAYAPQVRKIYGEHSRLGQWRHYDASKIESYLVREPEGVRVGVWRDKLITFNVCRSYGAFGWFHTLAVHPQFQDRGLGRQAVADAEAYLMARGVSSVALMTWPTAIKNLAFYQAQGYRLSGLSVYAYRNAEAPLITGVSPFYAEQPGMNSFANMNRWHDAVRALCQSISLGLDYIPLLTWANRQDFADILLLWREGRLQALALAYFFPGAHWAEGKLLLLHPALTYADQVWALEHMRLWIRSRDHTTFGIPVDLSGDFARTVLLPHGFRLFAESMANLVKGEDLPDPSHHFIRFGG